MLKPLVNCTAQADFEMELYRRDIIRQEPPLWPSSLTWLIFICRLRGVVCIDYVRSLASPSNSRKELAHLARFSITDQTSQRA